ncbi:NUDIX hydrolase [Chryseolinea soli]|uniref:NUDIX domain-containing protein n=1 Tax=Chryseolinea soli TaxID=2321403 RepID=A0A385SNB2_9BACT|nr:NUDIX hydrolase [Chryseolinea soli]AYB32332.1 NUDIX domain-containing protein [Chryseolinea soli]
MNRQQLIATLQTYPSRDPDEIAFVPRFLDLLHHADAYHRTHLPGHITGSAWIVDTSKKFVLLTHHAKLNKWLQPGGHADGDENILNVALREVNEETGLHPLDTPQSPFDIDIHPIPARPDFPEHLHYDVRFLFIADKNEPLLLSEESHALAWVPLTEVAAISQNNRSMMRMVDKLL